MTDYSASLTGEPFLYNETKIIAKYIKDGYDPVLLKKKNIEENLILYKTKGSIARTNSPIFRRIGVMSEKVLFEFINSDMETSKFILLYAIMKTDKIVKDFIVEVYRDKLLMKKEYIEKYDLDYWFESKIASSESLKTKSDSTIYKLKQVLMKIITDSGLVTREKNRFKIIQPLLSSTFMELLDSEGDIGYAKAIGGLI
ncbi:MAG: DUF1819 family protein [Bacilli bacterium]|jgi:hypothetical protein